jgi:hypothetical protein
MPRYFFHIMDGRAGIDKTGIFLADEGQARHEALRGASEMLTDDDMNIWLGNEWMMAVADEEGTILFKMRFSIEHPKRPLTMLS